MDIDIFGNKEEMMDSLPAAGRQLSLE